MSTGQGGQVVGLGFKRNLVFPGFALALLELGLVAYPAWSLIPHSPTQAELVARVGIPLAVVLHLLWMAIMALWLAPVQRAILRRRRGDVLDTEAARPVARAINWVPLYALGLRTALWVFGGVAIGMTLRLRSDWRLPQVVTLASVLGLYAYVVGMARAMWLARLLRALAPALLTEGDPLETFADRYRPRLLLITLLVGAAALGGLAAFVFYFLPIGMAQYFGVLTVLPGSFSVLTTGWVLFALREVRPIEAYVQMMLGPVDKRSEVEARAIAAYRAAQVLPYRLAVAKVLSWTAAAGAVAVALRTIWRMAVDDAVLLFCVAVVLLVGSAVYEAVWNRDTVRPLLGLLAARHRLPMPELRTRLSLRLKLLVSFGALTLLACGLSLAWGFSQYKKLATSLVLTQAQLKLDWIRSELKARVADAPGGPSSAEVAHFMREAAQGASTEGARWAWVPNDATMKPMVVGGFLDAPPLPWYVLAELRGPTRGSFAVESQGLQGVHARLNVEWHGTTVDLGAIALLYPGYRGSGPGLQRPLFELLAFFVVLFSVCGGIVVLAVREFTTPIRYLEQRTQEMARGDLAQPLETKAEGDEIGRLTFSVEEMRKALLQKLKTQAEQNVDLEREVQRRTADLARKNRELGDALEKLTRAQSQLLRAEKMASIGQLVAGIAHEINNPVNAIANTVGPLQETIDEVAGGSEDAKAMIAVIQRGARRTKEIVQALHNYSRTDDERVVEFDLNRGLDDSLELLRHHLKDLIQVERKYGDVGRIRGHAGQVNQVFMNLLTNAAQAVAGQAGAKIELTTERRDPVVTIRVHDNGPGIPPEHLPRIFDPFFTTKEVGQGTGLGLSIVHGIIERHGGSIEVDSKVGEGTTFTVTLPVDVTRETPARGTALPA